MKQTFTYLLTLAAISSSAFAAKIEEKIFSIENDFLKRSFSTETGHLTTTSINNKLSKQTLTPQSCDEIRLRISEGTDKVGTDKILTTKDFTVTGVDKEKGSLKVSLSNKEHGISLTAHYTLEPKDFYLRKQLTISSSKKICLERIDIDTLALEDAHQPYQQKAITAQTKSSPYGNWKPGLGQPLITTKTATFWGTEFPASYNTVKENIISCGYLYGRMLESNKSYTTYKSVLGVSDDPKYTSDAFYDYIHLIRARPLRLQTQYNSWFDYGGGVSREKFQKSVEKVNDELCIKRGVSPLRSYVIDDGWQDSNGKSDWSDMVWKVNGKFDKDFKTSFATIGKAKSHLGIWLSPGCNFGARGVVPKLREKGWGGLTHYMSLSNTKYMDMLEKRMVQLTKDGVEYFKLDGTFGHQFRRNFDIDGAANGVPTMPQLGTKGWAANDTRLNDSKYDELKSYYLVVGSERMMKIFSEMHKANPEVYIVISNGAYLSPWWVMHCDAVWMINAGDAAGGSSRTRELTYRDGVYHNIWEKENTHYPMNSLFNHEPKKVKSTETKDTFRKYLYMNMSRGTGFVELYLKTFKLQEYDWDVLAEGMLWVEDVFPTFARSRMHGGAPDKNEVYGFTAWNTSRGYVSIHNPSDKEADYTFTLNRDFGLTKGGANKLYVTSPLADSLTDLEKSYTRGDIITIKLKPREIRILNFDDKPKDWSRLKALQTRTKADYTPPKPIPVKGHAILGRWYYKAGSEHSREFTEAGICILRNGDKVVWKKNFKVKDPKTAIVDGQYKHNIEGDVLKIEGKYSAKKK